LAKKIQIDKIQSMCNDYNFETQNIDSAIELIAKQLEIKKADFSAPFPIWTTVIDIFGNQITNESDEILSKKTRAS
jgi:hypothetical protein